MQLIKIEARYLKLGDLILDFKTRELVEVKYVAEQNKEVLVDCGEADGTDYFNRDSEVYIAIDPNKLKIKKRSK